MDSHITTPATTPSDTVVPVIAEHIVRTPGVCGGKPRIAGTRIKVKHVYIWHERMGMPPARIVADYPHLTMAAVHAALAYYWDHSEEIQREIEEEGKLVAELKTKAGPSRLQEAGSPAALLAAMAAEPHLRPGDVDELERLIQEGRRPVSHRSPFATKRSRPKR